MTAAGSRQSSVTAARVFHMARPEPAATGSGRRWGVLLVLGLFAITTACVDGAEAPEAGTSGSAGVAPATRKAPQTAAVNSDPKQLFGMDDAGLTNLLGAPVFQRHDAPAELWQYRHKSCVLDLYLYRESGDPGGGLRVQHYDVRSTSGGGFPARDCLAALLKSRLAGKS